MAIAQAGAITRSCEMIGRHAHRHDRKGVGELVCEWDGTATPVRTGDLLIHNQMLSDAKGSREFKKAMKYKDF
jgi:hypothetical protein